MDRRLCSQNENKLGFDIKLEAQSESRQAHVGASPHKYSEAHPCWSESIINLAKVEGLRVRSSLKSDLCVGKDEDVVKSLQWWRRRVFASVTVLSVTWAGAFRFVLLLLLLAAVVTAFVSLPLEQKLKDLLLWIQQDLGPWGPLVLALVYIPLTVLAVPASILTIGGGYLFGLPVAFVADSIGATMGATAAFMLGRTVGRSYVVSKLKNYPKFQSVAIAVQRSGFKIVLLLRLVPLLPFNMLNYLLSVTPVHVGDFMLASFLGMMPITFALVYVGTTLKDLSDVSHGWGEVSTTRWVLMTFGIVISVIMMVSVAKVAKASLEKAIAENGEIDSILRSSKLPIGGDSPVDCHKPLIIKIDSMREDDK